MGVSQTRHRSIEDLVVHIDKVMRALFVIVVVSAGALFWVAPRPPMADLPQHVGQVAVLHDLLLGCASGLLAYRRNMRWTSRPKTQTSRLL
jgi:hypothetical protein